MLTNTSKMENAPYAVRETHLKMNGDLEYDRTHHRDSEKLKGFFFMVFPALRIRFKVLRDHGLLGKMSVNEVIFELSKMKKIVEKGGNEYFAAVPKKV